LWAEIMRRSDTLQGEHADAEGIARGRAAAQRADAEADARQRASMGDKVGEGR
jgi:hypothetical protein